MNKFFLARVSKVVLTAIGITLTISVFSPVVGQSTLNPFTQQLLAQQLNDNQESVLESQEQMVIFPEAVVQAVLQDLSQRTGVEISNLNVNLELEEKKWSNNCLELVSEGKECFDVVSPGWLVTVTNFKEYYVYHTNDNGSVIKLK